MPLCVICGDDYETLSWSGPTMPCACVAMVSKADARDMDPDDLDYLKVEWARENDEASA